MHVQEEGELKLHWYLITFSSLTLTHNLAGPIHVTLTKYVFHIFLYKKCFCELLDTFLYHWQMFRKKRKS